MRIATWNVNSVKQRIPRLLPWLDQRRPDVVCLQETKLTDRAFSEALSGALGDRGYQAARTSDATVSLARTRSILMPRSWWNMPAR